MQNFFRNLLGKVIGGAGRAIDVVGRKITPAIQRYTGYTPPERGFSERLEARGGQVRQQAGGLSAQQAQQMAERRARERGEYQAPPGQVQGAQARGTPSVTFGDLLRQGPGGGGGQGLGTSTAIDPNQLIEDELGNVVSDISNQIQFGNLTGLFPFDEALAKSAAVQRFAPYYAQTFQDFLRGLNLRQQRGTQDISNLLSELQERTGYLTGRAGTLLEQAQEQTGQQFAERGLFESGARRRAQGLLGLTQQKELQNLLGGLSRRGETAQEQQRRLLEDISVEKAQQERETARAQETDVASAIEQARGRALSGATELERYGPQPGEDFQNFIRRREETLRRFVYG